MSTLTFPMSGRTARMARSLVDRLALPARCIASATRSLNALIADHARAQWASSEAALHLRNHPKIRAAYVGETHSVQ